MKDATNVEMACSKARQLIRKRKHVEAISLLSSLTATGSNQPKVLETLAVAHSMAGEFEFAAEALENALRISPDRTSASVNLGAVYNRLGRHDDAIDRLNQAVKMDWKCVEAFYNLGIAHRKKKNYNAAKMMFQEAVRLRPEMVDAWLQLGSVFLDTSNAQLAASWFRKVLTRKPDHEKARKGLRAAEAQLRKTNAARIGTLTAVASDPQNAPPINRLKKLSLQDRSTIQSSSMEIEQATNLLLEWFQTESDSLLHNMRRQIVRGLRPDRNTEEFCATLSSQLEIQVQKAKQLDQAVARMREYHQRYVEEN